MSKGVSELVLDILTERPDLMNDNAAVAEMVRSMLPGAVTSAASVSSAKSGLRAKGLLNSSSAMTERSPIATLVATDLPEETYEERDARIRRRFEVLQRMADRIVFKGLPALIVSGPPGLGKSYTIEKALEDNKEEGQYDIICGSITAPGLLIALWGQKDGGVVVLDDCDDVFRDETCLNILKAVLDSSSSRRVSYRKRASWMDEYGIPQTFEFNGSVVFCTNIDFEAAIRKGNAMASHFEALIDRSLYLSLTMRVQDDYICRINQVALEDGMLENMGLTQDQAVDVMDFITENASRFYGLSLRLAMQIATCILLDEASWQDDVEATKMRTV
jgi:hypothetical protein